MSYELQNENVSEKKFEKDSVIYALYQKCVVKANEIPETRYNVAVEMLEEFPGLRFRVSAYLRRRWNL